MAAGVAFFVCASLTTSCSATREDRVLVLAATSTIDALEAAAADFRERSGIVADVSFGPTSTLARQVEEGAPADLLLSASREWADYVGERADVERRAALIGNKLVVIEPRPPGNRTANDLGEFLVDDRRRRIAIADPESVPAGIYARQALIAMGLWDAVEPRLIPTVDVRAALALVAAGEADAGFVYSSDSSGSSEVVDVHDIDPVYHEPIEYPLLLLARAGPEAAELFDFLVSQRGREHFLARGFIDLAR